MKPLPSTSIMNSGLVLRRLIQTTTHQKAIAPLVSGATPASSLPSSLDRDMKSQKPSALAILPLSHIIRTYLITRATSSPFLLKASLSLLHRMTLPTARFLSVDHNPILRWLFRHTFYAQFCAGENQKEVKQTLASLKKTGYSASILEYALELLEEENATTASQSSQEKIDFWKKGMLDSIEAVNEGDFVALKWSGMGSEALSLLNSNKPPSPAMLAAMTEVCDRTVAKGVTLLPSAELEITNQGIHSWTLEMQKKYNKNTAVIYNTYQAYLKSSPVKLVHHLQEAEEHGFVLGVKLVRGAYLASEKQQALCSSKQATDEAYDTMVEALLQKDISVLKSKFEIETNLSTMPKVHLMLACHNANSIHKAEAIRSRQAMDGVKSITCSYAQLQGMADDLSCELLQQGEVVKQEGQGREAPSTMKFTSWGTVSECLHYLYRRAAENQDAISRTVDTRNAMAKELWRRLGI